MDNKSGPNGKTNSKLKQKCRRGYGGKKKGRNSLYALSAIGTNSDGLYPKKESLFYLINKLKPSIITIQETKLTSKGKISIPGYEVIEHLRGENRGGGGLLTAALTDLNPTLVADDANVDLLVIQVDVGDQKIRILNGYGPQEVDDAITINSFWQTLELEITNAKEDGCLILLQLDANAKLGNELIKNDPNSISNNGKILLDLVKRQGMHIGNMDQRCTGTITREKICHNKVEQDWVAFMSQPY